MSSPGDPTVRMPSVGGGTPPPRPPAGVPPARDGRWWWIAVGLVVVIAVLVAVLVITDGGDDPEATDIPTTRPGTPDTSAVSATSITAPTTTAEPAPTTEAPTTQAPTTLAAPAVRIVSFTGPPSVACTAPTSVELTWSTENAQSIALSIDGTAFGSVGPTGTQTVPFACDGNLHTYALTATGGVSEFATAQLSISQTAG